MRWALPSSRWTEVEAKFPRVRGFTPCPPSVVSAGWLTSQASGASLCLSGASAGVCVWVLVWVGVERSQGLDGGAMLEAAAVWVP